MTKAGGKIMIGSATLIQKTGDEYLILTSATNLHALKNDANGKGLFFLQRNGVKTCAAQFKVVRDSIELYGDFEPVAKDNIDPSALTNGNDFGMAKVSLLAEGNGGIPADGEFPKIEAWTAEKVTEKIEAEENGVMACYPSVNPNKVADKENK